MHFDELLGTLGEFGRYQKRVYFLICFLSVSAGFHMVISVFLLGTPDHRCRIPGYPGDSYSIQNNHHRELVNASIPLKDDTDGEEYEKCHYYVINVSDVSAGRGEKRKCDEWVYDTAIFLSTFTAEVNLVCDRQLWTSNASMIFFAGVLIGAFALGALSDAFGRKKTLMLSILLLLCSSMGVAWAPDYATFCVLRFFVGFSCAGLFMTGFVLGMELTGPSKRVWAGVVIEYFFAIGLVVLAGLGYFIRHWKYIEIACAAPTAFFLLYWWFVPESPRWLLRKGKPEEAKKIILKIAKGNNKEITTKELDNLEADPTADAGKVWHLFTSRVLLIRTLIIFFNWAVVSMVYYGLSLNSGNLAGDFYLNFFLSGVVEFPAYTLCLVLLDRIGRKKLHASCMILGGLACVSTIFPVLYLDKEYQWVTVILAMLGKIGAAAAFAVIYVWAAELFPTVVRNAGMGASSSCARVGGMVSPYIADLSKVIDGGMGQATPLIIFGGFSVLAGLLSIYLPETLGHNLPDTIEDGIKFGE
ncbi:hypothetical protein FSP39_020715 [Pinctada imbricata]|uniref:Major facilitator superfamily (MFS) profile domain-containing protein n=1 Tax=Pinctada imbricata TaxID=66713 RepID=A0AA89C7W2_PINIB|nr:hypothetical protein FSP39_020715 [Pinctada imbricata]